jgi:hypothetical protein
MDAPSQARTGRASVKRDKEYEKRDGLVTRKVSRAENAGWLKSIVRGLPKAAKKSAKPKSSSARSKGKNG